MALRGGQVNLSYEALQDLVAERARAYAALQERLRELEIERDRALRGLEFMTEALRRRGCCDHDTSTGSL